MISLPSTIFQSIVHARDKNINQFLHRRSSVSGMRDMFQQIILKKLWEMKENYAQNVMAMPDQLRRSQTRFAEVRKGELVGQRREEDWAASPKRECMWENHRTYTEREKWERRNWRAGSWWVCAWVGLWLCLASFIHPREPPSDTSMKTQNSVIHSLLVLHGGGREKEQRRWLKRKSKEHFTSSMEANIKKKKNHVTFSQRSLIYLASRRTDQVSDRSLQVLSILSILATCHFPALFNKDIHLWSHFLTKR